MIFPNKMEAEVSKLKDKWAREFNNLSYFSKDNIWASTVVYVNLNKNIYVILYESHDELIEIEKEILKWKLSKE